MEQKRKNTRVALIIFSVLIIAAGAITIATSGVASAKYKTQKVANTVPVTVTVTADLADSLTISESAVTRQSSGQYVTGSGTSSGNTYDLMPGVDIPKDPFVRVTGKTEIPAFLYIEIVDGTVWSTANQRFEYKIGDTLVYSYSIDTANWKRIEQYSDRKIFVYAPGGTETPVTDADDLSHINILAPVSQANAATIVVSSGFDPETVSAGIQMQILPSMAQSADSNTAYEIFRTQLA